MTKLEAALAALQKSLGVQEKLHARAVRRMKARHAGQKKAERQAEAAHAAADKLNQEAMKFLGFGPNLDQARGAALKAQSLRRMKKAHQLERKASKERDRAIFWKGRARVLIQRIKGIEVNRDALQKEIDQLRPKVELENNRTVGGTFRDRWQLSNLTAVQCCSTGRRRNAYSQTGEPDIWHPYGPGPAAGRRDDCSSYTTSQARATGADDPNGLSFSGQGFTGTLVGAHGRWKEVSLSEMMAAGQGYIVYGEGTGHHVECYCPSESDPFRTVGHGSPPVDFGTVHLFGTGEFERYFIYGGKL